MRCLKILRHSKAATKPNLTLDQIFDSWATVMKHPPVHKGDFFWSLLVLAAFPPAMILLHELAHYVVAVGLGYHPTLCYDQVSIPPAEKVGKNHMALIVLAGPTVECILAILGLTWLIRNTHLPRDDRKVMRWLATAAAIAGLRWFKTAFDGPHSDEAKLSHVLGFHYLAGPLLLLIPSFLAAFIIWRFHRAHHSLLPLTAGFLACVISGLAWITYIGPSLLPHPEQKPAIQQK